MPIDFENLPVLPSPRRELLLRQMRLKERQQQNAIKTKGRKNHSVNRERSYVDRVKASKAAHVAAKRFRKLQDYREAVRAYWRCEREEHPYNPISQSGEKT